MKQFNQKMKFVFSFFQAKRFIFNASLELLPASFASLQVYCVMKNICKHTISAAFDIFFKEVGKERKREHIKGK